MEKPLGYSRYHMLEYSHDKWETCTLCAVIYLGPFIKDTAALASQKFPRECDMFRPIWMCFVSSALWFVSHGVSLSDATPALLYRRAPFSIVKVTPQALPSPL